MESGLRKLSEIPNQKQVTSVLRAIVIKKELPKPLVLVGGTKNLRDELEQSFNLSINCVNPNKGDYCNNCVNCFGFGAHPTWLVLKVDDLSEVEVPVAALVLDLNPDSTHLSTEYKRAARLVLMLMRMEPKDYLKAAEEYTGDMVSSLIQVFRDSIALRSGADVIEPTPQLRFIASNLQPFFAIGCLKVLWEAQARTEVNAQLLAVLLADVIRPSVPKPDETPILFVEEEQSSPLSFEELVSLSAT